MNAIARSKNQNNIYLIYISAIAISILLSLWMGIRTTVINPDAICYLESANMIGTDGLHQAMQLCGQAKWPFYSLLIYGFATFTQLSSLIAANILDGLFSLISVASFIYLVRLLGASRRTLWLAAATILLAHQFNSVREYIIRDHGFWAFYLVSISACIHYFRSPRWSYALLWSMSIMIAALFRIEGALFLVGVPMLVWFQPTKRFAQFLQLNTLTIVAGIGVAILLFSSHHEVGRLTDIEMQLAHGYELLTHQFLVAKASLAHNVLSPYSAKDAGLILSLLFFVWYLQSVIANLSLIYAVLAVYAWSRKLVRLDHSAKLVIVGYVLVNLLVTAAFLIENMFLSKRYLIALTLILMLWVPFALEALITERKQPRWVLPVVIMTIAVYALGGIFDFGSPKTYLREAGQWLAANTQDNTKIYSNNEQVMYYSHHFGHTLFQQSRLFSDMTEVANGKWKQYDYLALRVQKNELTNNSIIQELTMSPVKVFGNKHGDQVVIYQVSR
ncbi:MAG: hypothetical protein P4M14_05270 [Gammaproteobacteria bacterium]|nr:hypothetical protein [Gammaproteobacteria bacterium]